MCGDDGGREGVRIEATQRLLLAGHSVTAAAARSGLGSDETLRRAFARHLGTTPSEYRARFTTTGRQQGRMIDAGDPDRPR